MSSTNRFEQDQTTAATSKKVFQLQLVYSYLVAFALTRKQHGERKNLRLPGQSTTNNNR